VGCGCDAQRHGGGRASGGRSRRLQRSGARSSPARPEHAAQQSSSHPTRNTAPPGSRGPPVSPGHSGPTAASPQRSPLGSHRTSCNAPRGSRPGQRPPHRPQDPPTPRGEHSSTCWGCADPPTRPRVDWRRRASA
jgi:hypothetical protein